MCHNCREYNPGNPGQGFPQSNQGFPGHHPHFFSGYNQQFDPQYNAYYGPRFAPGFHPRYGFQNPSPQPQPPWGYEPPNPTANEGRISVSNNNCRNADTSNFGNTTMTHSGNNHQGNHHAENYGHIQSRNSNGNRTTRVGDVSSNGGNASANANPNGFMTNANVKGGTNHNSGYQYGGTGGDVNIGGGG